MLILAFIWLTKYPKNYPFNIPGAIVQGGCLVRMTYGEPSGLSRRRVYQQRPSLRIIEPVLQASDKRLNDVLQSV